MITQLRYALIYHIKIHSAVLFFSFVAQTYKKSHKYVQRFNDIDLYHFFVSRVLACILGDGPGYPGYDIRSDVRDKM